MAAARAAFALKGRLHLKDVLVPAAAEKLGDSLAAKSLWARSTDPATIAIT